MRIKKSPERRISNWSLMNRSTSFWTTRKNWSVEALIQLNTILKKRIYWFTSNYVQQLLRVQFSAPSVEITERWYRLKDICRRVGRSAHSDMILQRAFAKTCKKRIGGTFCCGFIWGNPDGVWQYLQQFFWCLWFTDVITVTEVGVFFLAFRPTSLCNNSLTSMSKYRN